MFNWLCFIIFGTHNASSCSQNGQLHPIAPCSSIQEILRLLRERIFDGVRACSGVKVPNLLYEKAGLSPDDIDADEFGTEPDEHEFIGLGVR